jgi:hypothetical protein
MSSSNPNDVIEIFESDDDDAIAMFDSLVPASQHKPLGNVKSLISIFEGNKSGSESSVSWIDEQFDAILNEIDEVQVQADQMQPSTGEDQMEKLVREQENVLKRLDEFVETAQALIEHKSKARKPPQTNTIRTIADERQLMAVPVLNQKSVHAQPKQLKPLNETLDDYGLKEMYKTVPLKKETELLEHQFVPVLNSTFKQTNPEIQSTTVPKIVVDPVESLPKHRQLIDSSYLSAPKKHSKRSKSKSREQIKSLQKDLRNCSNQVALFKENQFTLDTIIHYLRKEVRNLKHKLIEQAETIEELARKNRLTATI